MWIGALLTLWTVARRGNPPKLRVEPAARRASKVAFWSVVGLAITGTSTAYNGLGFDAYRLLFSLYGRTLIVKVVVFSGVLAIGEQGRAARSLRYHERPARPGPSIS